MKPLRRLLTEAPRTVLIAAIRLYQLTLSPFFGPCCRYTPSCSHYGAEAIARFGALRGGWLALRRILRCNPWGGAGDDPVPDHWSYHRHTPEQTAATKPRRVLTVERNRA